MWSPSAWALAGGQREADTSRRWLLLLGRSPRPAVGSRLLPPPPPPRAICCHRKLLQMDWRKWTHILGKGWAQREDGRDAVSGANCYCSEKSPVLFLSFHHSWNSWENKQCEMMDRADHVDWPPECWAAMGRKGWHCNMHPSIQISHSRTATRGIRKSLLSSCLIPVNPFFFPTVYLNSNTFSGAML